MNLLNCLTALRSRMEHVNLDNAKKHWLWKNKCRCLFLKTLMQARITLGPESKEVSLISPRLFFKTIWIKSQELEKGLMIRIGSNPLNSLGTQFMLIPSWEWTLNMEFTNVTRHWEAKQRWCFWNAWHCL
jgi:hypothetical protein